MISFRRADLLGEFQPRLGLNLDVDIVSFSHSSQTKSYWRVEIIIDDDGADPELSKAVERVIMGYDDFKRVSRTYPHPFNDYGFQGQWMEDEAACRFLIGEVISGIKDLDGVREVKSEPNEENDGMQIAVFL